ncbi:MAG: type II toxin-antitoxin system PemK/MazF family toxin [Defluviitaleaceae bacterium]|nr:type II toxin-antitoxin system PemK/MazF family toxin [Defluviitaleaceae bacterium]
MKQGDIILVDFDPTKGREQAGYRPAVVISQTAYNQKRDLAFICPITSSTKSLRFRVLLDDRTQTQGDIICEQMRVIDLLARNCKIVESLPRDLLEQVLAAVSVIITLEDE